MLACRALAGAAAVPGVHATARWTAPAATCRLRAAVRGAAVAGARRRRAGARGGSCVAAAGWRPASPTNDPKGTAPSVPGAAGPAPTAPASQQALQASGGAALLLALLPAAAVGATLVVPGVIGDDTLREGFVSGLLLIFFSEIGDKTFFIALLLALQNSRGAVFAGTYGALAVMTLISVGLGRVLHQVDQLLPLTGAARELPLDDYAAIGLLLFFGIKTIADANNDDDEEGEGEEAEAKKAVNAFEAPGALAAFVLSTFVLVFAAEWGDKSFLATIALAAASSPIGVIGGALVGHAAATGLAVLGGQLLAERVGVSEKVLGNVGGALFLVFAAATAVDVVMGEHAGLAG